MVMARPGWSRAVAADPDAEPERVAARVLRRVVAITFGEAAAAEMAERVGAALSALEAGHVDPRQHPDTNQHGQCCASDDVCGALPCARYEYGFEGCETVCSIPCRQGDRCPQIGGTVYEPDEAEQCRPEGFCPVGAPDA